MGCVRSKSSSTLIIFEMESGSDMNNYKNFNFVGKLAC